MAYLSFYFLGHVLSCPREYVMPKMGRALKNSIDSTADPSRYAKPKKEFDFLGHSAKLTPLEGSECSEAFRLVRVFGVICPASVSWGLSSLEVRLVGSRGSPRMKWLPSIFGASVINVQPPLHEYYVQSERKSVHMQ
jgi:hypothetical protein